MFQGRYMEDFFRSLRLTDFCSGLMQLKFVRTKLFFMKVSYTKFRQRFEAVCRILGKHIYGLKQNRFHYR
jgi:hypothetical protein